MNAQTRIQAIRLIERLKNNPDFAKKIEVGWEVTDKQNNNEKKSKKEVK